MEYYKLDINCSMKGNQVIIIKSNETSDVHEKRKILEKM